MKKKHSIELRMLQRVEDLKEHSYKQAVQAMLVQFNEVTKIQGASNIQQPTTKAASYLTTTLVAPSANTALPQCCLIVAATLQQ